jgi:hypothetical protein
MRPLIQSLVGLFALASLLGCGEELERPSQLDSLRIIAVRSDVPFATPTARPTLEMLQWDGSPAAPRPVHTLWIGGCLNPEGDLYYHCFPVLHQTLGGLTDADLAAEQVPSGTPEGSIGFGTVFSAVIPDDAITSRPQAEGVVYPYGVLFLFYAACAGELRHVPGANLDTDYPVGCYRPGTGEALGQDDFEFGYYPIYVYDSLTNQNPIISSLGFSAPASGAACTADIGCAAEQVCSTEGVCIPAVAACSAHEAEDCPGYQLSPLVDGASAEPAASALIAESRAPAETLWVSYYSTGGLFDKDTRLVNEPNAGWSDEYHGVWRPQLEGGREVRLFAVVRDSRGGVAWTRQDVWVK